MVITKGKARILITQNCRSCEWNFDGMCAAHGGFYNYGGQILNRKKECNCWQISFKYFVSLSKRLEVKNNRLLLKKVEIKLGRTL